MLEDAELRGRIQQGDTQDGKGRKGQREGVREGWKDRGWKEGQGGDALGLEGPPLIKCFV